MGEWEEKEVTVRLEVLIVELFGANVEFDKPFHFLTNNDGQNHNHALCPRDLAAQGA